MPDAVLDRWLAGWTAVRDVEVDALDGWPLVHVGSASRRTELVCLEPGVDALLDLTRHVADDPEAMLTVVTADRTPYLAADLPPTVRVDRDDETLMTVELPAQIEVAALELERTTIVSPSGVTRYELVDGGRLVAWGSLGVVDGWATFDRVETVPTHRRRGLGRHVMDRLVEIALQQDARHGVLAASADGRALYEALGWRRHLDLWSLTGA